MARKRHSKTQNLDNASLKYQQAADQVMERHGIKNRLFKHYVNNQVQADEKVQVRIRTTPVCWGIPMDEIMYSKFFTILWRHGHIMPWDDFSTTESTYLPDARNDIHQSFVRDSNYKYLMMLDSDVMPPPHFLEILMSHDLPIVGGWYKNKNQFRGGPHPIVYSYKNRGADGHYYWSHYEEPGSGIEQVDGMGAGCWLMKREVALSLGERPYDMAGGTEDLKLSYKLMEIGIPLHVDWNLECAHIGVSWV